MKVTMSLITCMARRQVPIKPITRPHPPCQSYVITYLGIYKATMPRTKSPPQKGGSSSKTAAKRLIKELDTWAKEQEAEQGIERLGPVTEGDLLEWQAVINGRDVGNGYDGAAL